MNERDLFAMVPGKLLLLPNLHQAENTFVLTYVLRSLEPLGHSEVPLLAQRRNHREGC